MRCSPSINIKVLYKELVPQKHYGDLLSSRTKLSFELTILYMAETIDLWGILVGQLAQSKCGVRCDAMRYVMWCDVMCVANLSGAFSSLVKLIIARPISQIPQYTCSIYHNAPLNRNVHISVLNGGMWDMRQVHYGICNLSHNTISYLASAECSGFSTRTIDTMRQWIRNDYTKTHVNKHCPRYTLIKFNWMFTKGSWSLCQIYLVVNWRIKLHFKCADGTCYPNCYMVKLC